MARNAQKILWSRSFQRTLKAMARTAIRAGSTVVKRVVKEALKQPPVLRVVPDTPGAKQRSPAKRKPGQQGSWSTGIALGPAGARRYRLYKPPGVKRTEHLPLLVMLHGCWQDAEALAACSQMNKIAAREHFFVLYPEQDRLSNAQACWNWHDTRTGRAQSEAGTIDAAIDQVCLAQAVDTKRIALVGISAGAGMAALLATRRPERFRAIVMHSGIAPGVAHSSTSALSAMRGRQTASAPLAPVLAGANLPALLVIHGSTDHIVAPSNGSEAAQRWADRIGAKPGKPRVIQRGARYPATVTDYRIRGRLAATLCEVKGLGHAWSGGATGRAYSDPKGPDASRMIWTFAAKQFASGDS